MGLTAICALACALLVGAEATGSASGRIAGKCIASAAFVAIGASALGSGAYAAWIVLGLALGAIGDVCLLGRGSAAFLAGLAAFLLGHLAYVAGIAAIEPPARWFADAGALAAVPIAAGSLALALLWRRLGSMRAAVVAYVAAIVAMVVGAIAAARAHALPDPQRTRLAVGACLFFVSDLAVARDRFVGRSLANRLWGLPAYYAGQLLIAWSLLS